jgi:anthranilate synthase/aminodeoxychorismate synthase-like glutamine amidotransferase
MILVIDNYDSFTYNLVQLLGTMTGDVEVRRNDAVDVAGIRALDPDGIVISPGPGRPEQSGVTLDVIAALGPELPVLGICLGHQAIGLAFGGSVVHASTLKHGKTSLIHHDTRTLFKNIASPFEATRYHSLVISPEQFPKQLEVSARTDDGVIMGVRHREYPIEGVQFHPESVLTQEGEHIIRNWLEMHT